MSPLRPPRAEPDPVTEVSAPDCCCFFGGSGWHTCAVFGAALRVRRSSAVETPRTVRSTLSHFPAREPVGLRVFLAQGVAMRAGIASNGSKIGSSGICYRRLATFRMRELSNARSRQKTAQFCSTSVESARTVRASPRRGPQDTFPRGTAARCRRSERATMARPPRAQRPAPRRFLHGLAEQLGHDSSTGGRDERGAVERVSAYTGGELVAFRWVDLDLERDLTSRSIGKGLARRCMRSRPRVARAEKGGRLDEDLVSVLRAHRVEQTERRLQSDPAGDNDLVFCEIDGSMIHDQVCRSGGGNLVARRARGLLGVPTIRLHDLRHFARPRGFTDAGVRPGIVTERLGRVRRVHAPAGTGTAAQATNAALPRLARRAAGATN